MRSSWLSVQLIINDYPCVSLAYRFSLSQFVWKKNKAFGMSRDQKYQRFISDSFL